MRVGAKPTRPGSGPSRCATGAPLFIGSEIYRHSSYGAKHPLAIPRVSAVTDLVRTLGWLPDQTYIDSPVATPAQLARFHAPDYIDAVMRAEAEQRVDAGDRDRYRIGANGNPVFRHVFRRPATACGASIHAAGLLAAAPAGVIHSPAGGTHHGRPDRASGFCYFNDPVLGILALLDAGLERVLYVDIDAHHCDGVQDALSADRRILMLSVHEDGRWPRTGAADDRGGGNARNLPVPPGFNDSEMEYLLETVILPLGEAFRPEAVVLQCGADSLADDPMSRLDLSNNAHRRTVSALRGLASRFLVLGGGGYNPWATARCWAGVWGLLNGYETPDRLSPPAEMVLRGLWWNRSPGKTVPTHWVETLADVPNPGPVREEVRTAARTVLAA